MYFDNSELFVNLVAILDIFSKVGLMKVPKPLVVSKLKSVESLKSQ